MTSQPPKKDEHTEDEFRDNPETELAVKVQEDSQEAPLVYQKGQEYIYDPIPDPPTVMCHSIIKYAQTN